MSYRATAARQHALVTNEQLLASGMTARQVECAVARGDLERVGRSVLRVAGAPVTWQQLALAACLSGPRGTVASHLTGAALAGLAAPSPLPYVTVPRSASGRLRNAHVHHADIDPLDVIRLFGTPVTSVPRTIVDCATVLSRRRLADVVDTAFDRGLADADAVLAAMERARCGRGRKGSGLLRDVLAAWTEPITPGSPAEARLFRQLLAWGFERPVMQHEVVDEAGRFVARLDVAWPRRRVGLEYDSTRFHNPRRFEADEVRHADVEALGWRLLRADKLDLRPGETRLRTELSRAFAARQAA